MTNYLRLVVGILGNAASLLLYGAPIVTFRRVIKNRSTEEFSGFPYAIALLNSLLYTWYGSPLISNGLENILVLTINGVGIILEFLFVCIYLKYALPTAKVTMVRTIVGMMLVFASISTVSLLAFRDQKHRKMLVGTSGMVVTVVMYASPLSNIRSVLRTKSVEFMPIHFSLFALINSCLWMIYFLVDKNLILAVTSYTAAFSVHLQIYFQRIATKDPGVKSEFYTVLWSMQCPNILGVPLGTYQIALYSMYWKQASNEEKIVDRFDPEIGLNDNADADERDSTPQQNVEMQTQ